MLGRSHVIWAGTTSLALLGPASAALGHPLEADQVAVAAGLSGGAALLNDLDQPRSTISSTLGPITEAIARVVHRISGGHRHATHGLLFPLLVALFAWGLLAIHPAVLAPLVFITYALALRVAGPRSLRKHGLIAVAVVSAICTYLSLRYVALGWYVPWAFGIGVAEHTLSDCLTHEGCPLLWPQGRHFKLPLISRTGNLVEVGLTLVVSALGLFLLFHNFGGSLHLTHVLRNPD